MLHLTSFRKNNKWFNILLYVISFTFIIVWLPLIRSICDGHSYQWGTSLFGFSISGRGISSGLVFVFVQFIFYIWLFMSFYWIKNRKVFKTLVISWYLLIFGNLYFDIIANGDTMFHGDTLNVHISLTMLIVPLGLITLGLIFIAFLNDANYVHFGRQWSGKNTKFLLILFGPLPVQALFFATGEPHGITDQIAVIISILQALLVPLIVRPYVK